MRFDNAERDQHHHQQQHQEGGQQAPAKEAAHLALLAVAEHDKKRPKQVHQHIQHQPQNKHLHQHGFSKSKWLPWLFTVALLAVFGKLSLWQWQRAEQKAALLSEVASRPVLSLEEALAKTNPDYWPVTMKGRWLPTAIFWDNRTLDGQVGYDLLQPFATSRGVFLIDRGWLAGVARRDLLPSAPLAHGEAAITGRLRQVDPGFSLKATAPEKLGGGYRVQSPAPEALTESLGLPLQKWVLSQEPSGSGFIAHWPLVVMPPEKHRAYSLQWASMALALMVAFGCWLRAEHRRKHE